MIARLAAATAAALVLVACGGDDGGRYDDAVDGARDAVRAGDRGAVLASLEEIGADARQGHAEGDVSDEELFELTALIEQARAQVDDELPAPTTTPPTTADTTPPETAPPVVVGDGGDDDDDEEKKGKGRGGDDGDDDHDD